MRIASYALWLAAPLSLGSVTLIGSGCSSSENTTAVAADAAPDATKTGDAGGKETSVDVDSGPSCKLIEQVDPSKAACNTCAEESCCAEANACTEEKDCKAFVGCATACLADAGVPLDGGAAGVDAGSAKGCLAACQKSHQDGVAVYQSLAVCIQGTCKSECL